MTGQELADADGIYYDRRDGRLRYYIPCEVCGREIVSMKYSHMKNYLCPTCKAKMNGEYVEKKQLKLDYTLFSDDVKHANRFNKAVKYVRKLGIEDIEDGISKARVMQSSYGSVPECIVAIELLRLGYTIVPQQKLGRYTVDFILCNERIIVEVDGEMYHQNNSDERDKVILDDLGILWRIVHITDKEIYQDIHSIQTKIETCKNKAVLPL